MSYRLYYWFEGASPCRVGGPWWYQDFRERGHRAQFIRGLRGSLYSYAIMDSNDLPVHTLQDIYPPEGVKRWYKEGSEKPRTQYQERADICERRAIAESARRQGLPLLDKGEL